MANSTVQDWINTLTPEELALELPIDFQDVSIEDAALVNQYNTYLSIGEYQSAYNYRVANPNLEKYIFDAKKMNYLQSLALNAYVFAKGEKSAINTSYDNSKTRINANNLQDALDYMLLNHKSYEILTESQYRNKGSIVNTDGIVYYVK